MMGVIGRREWMLIMKLDDQTRRERAALDRGINDIRKTTKKATEDTNRSIIDIAKASKQNMEGIKAVMELGGWLMMARQVGKSLADITAEARKNSAEFKNASAALAVVKGELGSALVEALEPLAQGFKTVLINGTAVVKNFPEVAKVAFKAARDLLIRALDPATFKNIFASIGQYFLQAFKTAIEMLPGLLGDALVLLAPKLMSFIDWAKEQAARMKEGKWAELEKYDDAYIAKHPIKTGSIGDVAANYGRAYEANLKAAVGALKDIGANFGDITDKAGADIAAIIAPTVAALEAKLAARLADGSGEGGWRTYSPTATMSREEWERLKEGISWDGSGAETRYESLQRFRESQHYRQSPVASAAEEYRGAYIKPTFGDSLRANLSGTELGGAGLPGMSSILGTVAAFVSSLSSVQAIMNPLTTIMQAAFEVLGPIINNLLAPLVGILKIVGFTIGKLLAPALELLRPIIEFVAKLFVWVYNTIIVPVGNAIIGTFNLIYNGFATFINGVIWLVDQIPFVDMSGNYVTLRDINAGMISKIDVATLGKEGSASSSTSSGSSASYAAGTTIKVDKIEISIGVLAGRDGKSELIDMVRDGLMELAETRA